MAIEPPLGVGVPAGWERDEEYVEGEHGVLDAVFSPSRAFIIEAQEEGTREEMWLELVLHMSDPEGSRYVEFTRTVVKHTDHPDHEDFANRVDQEVERLITVSEMLLRLKQLA